VEAESEEDALSLVAEHASEVHGIDEVSPEMIERVKAVIERDPIES
jgi:predicted small metal-binding protein